MAQIGFRNPVPEQGLIYDYLFSLVRVACVLPTHVPGDVLPNSFTAFCAVRSCVSSVNLRAPALLREH